MLVLSKADVQALASPADALEAVRSAFDALEGGAITMMSPVDLDLGERSQVHCRGAYLHVDRHWSMKVASSVAGSNGEPRLAGLSLVFDAETGEPRALIQDGGYLTELRTGAAGALAAEHLCDPGATVLTIIGTGSQARFQLDALIDVREWECVRVVSRSPERAQLHADWARERHSREVVPCSDAEAAVGGASLVVTTTPSREPVLRGEWLSPGAHVLAVGADTPVKRELDAVTMTRAAVVCVDDVEQASTRGEVRSALREGLVSPEGLTPLARVLAGDPPVRRQGDVSVTDLTGLGAQDAAIAIAVVRRVEERNVGVQPIEREMT